MKHNDIIIRTHQHDNGQSYYEIIVNGEDISAKVTGFDFKMTSNAMAVLSIELIPDELIISADKMIEVPSSNSMQKQYSRDWKEPKPKSRGLIERVKRWF